MTVSNPEMQHPAAAPLPEAWMEDEIDLREYILVLVAWWREILLLAVLTAVAGAVGVLLYRAVVPPVYEAAVTVAIARTKSDISFDQRFRTLSQEDTASLQNDVSARRSALVGLVANGSVAQAVIDQLGDLLTEEERNPATLLGMVEAELATPGNSRGASDLIRIKVRADSPQKAAAIANAWGQQYVAQVNRLYGQLPTELVSSVERELTSAQTNYDQAQKALESFIAQNQIDRLDRLITEKKEIIRSLQEGRQTAVTTIVDEELAARRQIISAYINAQANNRLLAFNKEQEAKQAMISALIEAESSNRLKAFRKDQEARQQIFDQYVQALIQNRLLAFNKEQEARSKLFAQYVNTEIDNRLAALTQEQATKSRLFQAYTSADAQSKVTVFNEQVQAKLQALTQNYDTKRKLERLLADAQALRIQAQAAGEASAATNSLAILLLKAEVYATSTGLPGNLQLTLGSVADLNTGAAGQVSDLEALTTVLEDRIAQLDATIKVQSTSIFNNEGYNLLDASRPADDPLFAALKEKYLELFDLGTLAQSADTVQASDLSRAILNKYQELFTVGPLANATDTLGDGTELSDAILARYNELFGVGPLATASTVFSTTTPLFSTIQEQYPELFKVGELSNLTEQVANNTPLALLSEERAQELLQLQGLEDLPAYSAAAEPLLRAIDKLEQEIQGLEAQQEAESARRKQLTQERDLAWSTLTTLANKVAELNLASTASNSEVRFAAPAVEPLDPVKGPGLVLTTALAGIVGLMLAVFVAFFANFMGAGPFLGKKEDPQVAPVS